MQSAKMILKIKLLNKGVAKLSIAIRIVNFSNTKGKQR